MKCRRTGCTDQVPEARRELGYKTCLEHGDEKHKFVVIDVPKSNPIIGKREDMAGAASSHKGNRSVSREGDREWYQEFTAWAARQEIKPDPNTPWRQRPIMGIRHDVAKALMEAKDTPSGLYVNADERTTTEGYRLGYFSSRYVPSRLTNKGLELRGKLCGMVDLATEMKSNLTQV